MDLHDGVRGAKIVLLGLDRILASELESVLKQQEHTVRAEPDGTPAEWRKLVSGMGADIVFCPAQRERYLALLEELRRESHAPPVVVVSRAPEVSDWLDAMEAGASDYCTAPFEPGHIAWIVDSNVRSEADPLLYRTAG